MALVTSMAQVRSLHEAGMARKKKKKKEEIFEGVHPVGNKNRNDLVFTVVEDKNTEKNIQDGNNHSE